MRPLSDERGSALITALLSTLIMLALGLALLSVVDVQDVKSAEERTLDRSFNLSESVLTSEAFVLGRSWPDVAPSPNLQCGATGADFGDPLGAATASSPAADKLKRSLDASYRALDDPAYTGASWRATVCDDVDADGAGPGVGGLVWDDSLLTGATWDANGNSRVWVRAQATVEGKLRRVAGLVKVRSNPALNPRYALVTGGVADDLGTTLSTLQNDSVVRGVVKGLIDQTPTVARDPSTPAGVANGVTGLRCGALDIQDGSTCVSGTLAATGAIPLVSDLVTGGKIENFPTTTTATEEDIARLRAQAVRAGTYTAVSPGTAPVASANTLNPTDTGSGTIQACTITGTPDSSSVVFIEQVGTSGTANTVGGPGDQYCAIDVTVTKHYRAIVVGSGRIVLRGNNATTAASNAAVNTFQGNVYALNLQRLPVADGGRGLGDTAAPGREVVRIDRGAHVRGSVSADGKSAKVGVYPPPITLDKSGLVTGLIPCIPGTPAIPPLVPAIPANCTLRNTILLLVGDTDALISALIAQKGLTAVTAAVLAQAEPQRTAYGSAITADVATINALTVYGASGVLPGTFRDLAPRV